MRRSTSDSETERAELTAGELMSAEDFWKAFERLDALDGRGIGRGIHWDTPKANKRHVDLFGDSIGYRELYFRKQPGGPFGDAIKLSRRSMEKLLYSVVEQMPLLQRLGDRMIEEERTAMAEMVAALEQPRVK